MLKWTYEDLKSFAAARSVDLFKAVKPQDMAALPEAAQALWKIGWDLSAQYDCKTLLGEYYANKERC
jgi:hypothetical protein